MDVNTLVININRYFDQRERCFDNCWSTHSYLKLLDQEAAGWFYLLTKNVDSINALEFAKPSWLDLLLARTVTEMVAILRTNRDISLRDTVCLQWWSQRHNGAALIAAIIRLEAVLPEDIKTKERSRSLPLSTQQLLCIIASATPVINDQFNFLHIDNIQPCINFINQHLGSASHVWCSHFLDAEASGVNENRLALSLCRGTAPAKLPMVSSELLADKSLLKQYVVQADAKQVGMLINDLSAHNDNAKFVLSIMALSGYKQFIPWLIQMLTAGFLSRAAFSALHTLLGIDFEKQLPDALYGEYEPESQLELLVELKQSLAGWWLEQRDDYPERILAGNAINSENIAEIWRQGNIEQCEVAVYHHWCRHTSHRLTDVRVFNVGAML